MTLCVPESRQVPGEGERPSCHQQSGWLSDPPATGAGQRRLMAGQEGGGQARSALSAETTFWRVPPRPATGEGVPTKRAHAEPPSGSSQCSLGVVLKSEGPASPVGGKPRFLNFRVDVPVTQVTLRVAVLLVQPSDPARPPRPGSVRQLAASHWPQACGHFKSLSFFFKEFMVKPT